MIVSGVDATCGLTETGPGLLVLGAQNSYPGQTLIAGNLQLGVDNALPVATVVQIGDPTLGSGVLDLNGYNQTLAGLFTGTASAGNDTDADAVTSNSTVSTLAVENTADDTFAGRLAGSLSLDKFGAGTLTLTGDCTTEEPALVYDGTLDVEGILLATAQTVAGYGNPQLVLPGDPDYDVVVETSGTGPSQRRSPREAAAIRSQATSPPPARRRPTAITGRKLFRQR